jgi:hypothetical protein
MNLMQAWLLADAWLAILAGLGLLWWPQRHMQAAEARRSARIAELDAGSPERFFEERRSLEAYPMPRRLWLWRFVGLSTMLAGVLDLARSAAS